jgi:hypothetical protein
MARKGSTVSELQKKRKKNQEKVKNLGGTKTYVENRKKNTNGGGSTTTTTKKMTARERAQAAAKARIKSGKTINDLKIANKAAMKARAKAKYEAFKKKRKK